MLLNKKDFGILKKLAPKLFSNRKEPKPLEIGILKDLCLEYCYQNKDKTAEQAITLLQKILKRHTHTNVYHKAMIDNTHRYNMKGEPVSVISEEHKNFSKIVLSRRENNVKFHKAKKFGDKLDNITSKRTKVNANEFYYQLFYCAWKNEKLTSNLEHFASMELLEKHLADLSNQYDQIEYVISEIREIRRVKV